MLEKWKLSLKEFLKKYEEDEDVIGAILCGSYVNESYTKYSSIDVYLVLKDNCTYYKKGNVESNSYLVEYYMANKDKIIEFMDEEFDNNKLKTANMFAYGKVIYDLEDSLKYLQDKALEYIDKNLKEITSKKLDSNNYHLWNYLNELKISLEDESPQFNLLYYSLLKDIYDIYAEFLSLPKLQVDKIYNILIDEEYRRNHHIYKLPDKEFIKLYLKCFEIDNPNVMYKNMENLINYYYKKQGGFNIRTFELTNEV